MNTQNNNMEDRLWNFIDGSVSADERSVIERLLESDAAWKEKYRELLEVNALLKSSDLEAPSMRFTKNVMEEIAKLHIAPATRTYINKRIIWGLTIFFVVMIVGFIVYGVGQTDWAAGSDSTLSKNINTNLSKIDLSKFFNNTWMNVLMMINVVLGLFLFDNYLNNKRKQFRQKTQ